MKRSGLVRRTYGGNPDLSGMLADKGETMANILIIDDQAWVTDLCKEGLAGEGHRILATDNIESVGKNVLSFKPNIVLLNQYLKYGFLVYDVLRDIKMQNPNLPVLIVTAYDNIHLSSSRLSHADGFLFKSPAAADKLRRKVSALLNHKPADEEAGPGDIPMRIRGYLDLWETE